MAQNIPYADVGVAGIQTDAFKTVELIAGDTPALYSDYGVVGATLAASGIPAYTPVKLDLATRAVTLAVKGTNEANALTIVTIQPGSAATGHVPVYMAGCFNPNAINWPASYVTAGDKASAFAAAPDSQIAIKAPFYA